MLHADDPMLVAVLKVLMRGTHCLPCHLQAIVDAGAVAYLAPLVINQDAKLKRQVGGAGHRLLVCIF